MINDDLIKYIDTQKSRGISREGIFKKLSDAGWEVADINEGLNKIFTIDSPVVAQPTQATSFVAPSFTPPVQSAQKSEDLIPNLMPKVSGPAGVLPINQTLNTLNSNPSPVSNSFDSFRPVQNPQPVASVNVMSPGPLPQSAVISSYRKDYQDTGTINNAPSTSHWGRFFLILLIMVLLLGGGVIFAGVKGYINLPFEIPFLKPTPEQAMNKMMMNLSKVQTMHYDVDFNIDAVTNTTYKIGSNESSLGLNSQTLNDNQMLPEDSKEEVNINIKAQGDIDNTNPQSPKYDTKMNIGVSPSIFGFTGIDLGFRLVGENLYVKVPPIDFIKEFIGDVEWINIQKSDLLDQDLVQTANNVSPVPMEYDIKKQKAIMDLFAESNFIGSVVEVGIDDIETGQAYHYQTTIDNEKLKNFFSKAIDILDNPELTLSRQELLNNLNDVKEIKVDIWVTKGSFMLHKIIVEAPIEKSDSFDNFDMNTKLNLKYTQTFSKINEPVSITAPSGAKTIKDLMSEYESKPAVKDSKIKANIYNFQPEAELFFDQHANTYGKPNLVGNCASAITGSVFAGSDTIKSILDLTGGVGSCYSTTKAYAISVPLASDPTTRFCMDSQGTRKETKTPLIGTVCK